MSDDFRDLTKKVDVISRQAAIAVADFTDYAGLSVEDVKKVTDEVVKGLKRLPSAQPEQSESEDITFWKKRAREYEEMVLKLTDEMARGIKIDSMLITEEGIVFKKKKQEPKWIPVAERLPEVGRCVLFSVGGMYVAEGCLREDGDWAQFRWSGIQSKDIVDVWMPLPEPYRGE